MRIVSAAANGMMTGELALIGTSLKGEGTLAGSRHHELASFIWSVADLLRGDYKQSEYRKVILPFTVLRRLDCVMTPTREAVWAENATITGENCNAAQRQAALHRAAGALGFYNLSRQDFTTISADPANVARNLADYCHMFSSGAREILDRYDFQRQCERLDTAGLLYKVVQRFADINLSPKEVDNHQMGCVFEELIRKFSESSNETAGEHFTPRDVTQLMVNLLLVPDANALNQPGRVINILDPACGTGGMLSAAEEHIAAMTPHAAVDLFGQELNAESYAICRSDMLIKGQDPSSIVLGNSISSDGHRGRAFDYMLANPPFGVEWKKVQDKVTDEFQVLGPVGRFGAGLPRINDGSFLFLQHMISKMKPVADGGARLAIVFNGSPLFTGGAGSGESEIRRWILENDWLEAIVALPDQLFYNTGIATYIWILSNRKEKAYQGKVILLDAREHYAKVRQGLGSKRKYITSEQMAELTRLFSDAATTACDPTRPENAKVRLYDNADFGYQRIVVERPLRVRFEVTADTATRVETAKPVAKFSAAAKLLDAIGSLVGQTWWKKADFESGLRSALAKAGVRSTLPAPVERAVLAAVSVTDSKGEVQTGQSGAILPDQNLRTAERLPLGEDADTFIRREVIPRTPDAWIDHSKTKIGYEIPRTLFFTARWGELFEPLERFARQVALQSTKGLAGSQLPVLRARDLQVIGFAAELSEFPAPGEHLAPCSGGDIVGLPGNWRLLPEGFGTALTPLKVLRPVGHSGRALCEWLNSSQINDYGLGSRVPMSAPVPLTAIMDAEFDQLLEDLHEGRRSLSRTTSRILPNVFRESANDLEDVRKKARIAASEARLIDELVRPLEDPLWRAEWSYPYHVAALARQYRIAVTPDTQKDGILKLGEGIARTLGILALAVQIRRHGSFSSALRNQFRNGATFGVWLRIIKQLVEAGAVPELQELGSVLNPGNAYEMLDKLQDFRNDSHHAHGVRSHHQLEDEVALLEPILMSSLASLSWMSGLRWELVDQCQFLGNGNQLIGECLRGSHPDWEPFARFSSGQLTPNRIYVQNPTSGAPIDLWPIASGERCTKCFSRELFLLDRSNRNSLVLRSLKEHTVDHTLD
jgi:type I restriction enzyme M protein